MTAFSIIFLIEPLTYYKMQAAETGHAAHAYSQVFNTCDDQCMELSIHERFQDYFLNRAPNRAPNTL